VFPLSCERLSDLSLASELPPSKLSGLLCGCRLLLQGHGTVWKSRGFILGPLLGCTCFPLAVVWSIESPVGPVSQCVDHLSILSE
jgi:hypothetical protein